MPALTVIVAINGLIFGNYANGNGLNNSSFTLIMENPANVGLLSATSVIQVGTKSLKSGNWKRRIAPIECYENRVSTFHLES